jgi:GGDEF domain-containing protein
MNPAVLLRKQLSYFIGSDEESPIYLFRSPASPMFGHERAAIILRRMEVLTWVFMILVPLWILADIMIFPTNIVTKLIFGRIFVTLCLGLLLIFSLVLMKRATWLVSYLSLLFLMAIPALFELYAQPIFTTWQLSHAHISETQAAAIFLYRQLPIIYISGLALFPLTLFESLPIAIAITLIDAVVDMDGMNLHSLHAAHWASLWVVFVTGGTAILAGVLQFNLFWQNHRLADFDAETGLMKREAALEWLRLLWNDRSRQGQSLGISLMALPQLAADARDNQAGTRLLSNEGEFLNVHVLPGMHGVRWSTQQLGVISLGHTQQELENMMNATYGQTATLTGSHGNRLFAVAERTTDHSVGPLNLLSIAEKKLRHAITSG